MTEAFFLPPETVALGALKRGVELALNNGVTGFRDLVLKISNCTGMVRNCETLNDADGYYFCYSITEDEVRVRSCTRYLIETLIDYIKNSETTDKLSHKKLDLLSLFVFDQMNEAKYLSENQIHFQFIFKETPDLDQGHDLVSIQVADAAFGDAVDEPSWHAGVTIEI